MTYPREKEVYWYNGSGHYLNSITITVAETIDQAKEQIEHELMINGLYQKVDVNQINRFPLIDGNTKILFNGDY